jgi:hypothetical protein
MYRGAMKRLQHVGLCAAVVIAALVTGGYGGWLVDWVAGDTATVTIDPCYVYYGRQETRQVRCEGYWHRQQSVNLANGPVVGVHVTPNPALVNSQDAESLGFLITPGSYDSTAFAVLNGDAAVVVPAAHMVLGPLGLVALLTCGLAIVLRKRRGTPRAPAEPSGLMPAKRA